MWLRGFYLQEGASFRLYILGVIVQSFGVWLEISLSKDSNVEMELNPGLLSKDKASQSFNRIF